MKKLLSLVLVLLMCLGLATPMFAANTPPKWNFLVVFAPVDADYEENGVTKHLETSLSQDDRTQLIYQLVEFESFMENTGVMDAEFKKLAINTPITTLSSTDFGPYPSIFNIADYLEDCGVSIDGYDHVIVYARMDGAKRNYGGLTDFTTFENGATYSFIPADYCLQDWGNTPKRPAYVVVHEFLHTMELTCGFSFDLHAIEDDVVPGYQSDEKYKACMEGIILNRITGTHGSGVYPSAWSHSLRSLHTIQNYTVPNDVTAIGSYQFKGCTNLKRVVIPSTVTSFGDHAFQFCFGLSDVVLPSNMSSIPEGMFEQCTALTEITIPSGVTGIGTWAFEGCTSLRKITIPVSVTKIGGAAFQNTGLTDVFYAGTQAQWNAIENDGYNWPLTNATIHYRTVGFADVPVGAYYADPVLWAVGKGITAGTSLTTFSPNQNCTVAQILTFLWRANGSPDPSAAVSSKDYYAKAVRWAVEKGIASNVTPNAPCTRSMAVEYIWKAAGSPSAKAARFTDVPAGATYANAVAWAVAQGVTNGTSATTFSPDNVCTRGQIVTFLYLAFAK